MMPEAIDKLFLELQHCTSVKTKRELYLEDKLKKYIRYADYCHTLAFEAGAKPQNFIEFATEITVLTGRMER